MVLKRSLYFIIRIAIFFAMISVFSCEEYPIVTNCENCLSKEPTTVSLILKIDKYTESNYPRKVTVRLYEGNLEDDVLINEFLVADDKYEVTVKLNRKYSATATYIDEKGNTYIAVDSATPKVRFEKHICENPCYWIYDRIINLKIKYF